MSFVSYAIPPWIRVAAIFAGAIAVGAILAVVVTAAGRGLAGPAPSLSPSVVAAASVEPASPPPTRSSTPEPSEAPSPSPVATASASPDPSLVPAQAGLPEGCFSEGLVREDDAAREPIIAKDLQRRLPLPSYWSEPTAVVGSSANRLFVSAFAACTGADPAHIRWGGVNGGLISGTFPQAVQVDGFTGPELARILLDGYLHPEQRAALEVGHHAGWTYRFLDERFAVTASRDTVYWYWVWPCCYEGPLFQEQSFVEVIHTYLDLTNDDPIDWR